MGWQVEFFADEKGNAPVEKFLIDLALNQKAKALALIRMLERR